MCNKEELIEESLTFLPVRMTKKELIEQLKELVESSWSNAENAHAAADKLLLEFVNDSEITEAFEQIEKYYA